MRVIVRVLVGMRMAVPRAVRVDVFVRITGAVLRTLNGMIMQLFHRDALARLEIDELGRIRVSAPAGLAHRLLSLDAALAAHKTARLDHEL